MGAFGQQKEALKIRQRGLASKRRTFSLSAGWGGASVLPFQTERWVRRAGTGQSVFESSSASVDTVQERMALLK